MTVRPYPAYRQSRIPWVGDVPATWTVAALKYVVSMKSGEQITAEDMQDGGSYPVFDGNGLRGFTSSYTHEGYFALVGRQGALCGNVNYADGQFWASEHAVVVHQRQRFAVRWMGELLRSMDLGQYSITAAQPGLSVEAIGNLRIPLPPFAEQSAIAAFLDRETGKIDALVAEQERLIALLKEKRQAVISHAVTKGLNPNAPMKDSGVPWLGEVPAHWLVGRCNYYFNVLPGFAFASVNFSQDDADMRLMRGTNVGVSAIHWDDVVYWKRTPNDSFAGYELFEGDLVLGMDRPWISSGVRVAKVTAADVPSLLLQRVARISPLGEVSTDILELMLSSEFFISHFGPEMTGVSVPHISPDQIDDFKIPVPPESEQAGIVAYTRETRRRSDRLVEEVTRATTLLRERRAALISAAATGKIDVRDTVAQPSSQAA